MSFLAPLLLLGLAAVSVPIAIHLFGRRRAKVVPFAALEFLFQSNRKTARRMQIKEKALLVVRAAACLVVPLALAKPYTSCARLGPNVERGAQAAVIIVDDSFASGIKDQDNAWLARATSSARDILTQLGPEAEIALVRSAQGAEMPTELTRDQLRIRDQLLSLSPSVRPSDTRRALESAAQLLSASSHARKTVFLLSLVAQTGLPAGPAPWGSNGPTLVVVDVPIKDRNNRAVTKLAVSADTGAGGAGARGIAVTAEIFNASTEPAKDLAISLSLDGETVARGQLDLAPFERKTKRFLAVMPKGRNACNVEVSITADNLAIDDTRMARALLRDDVRVLIIDGDPRTNRREDEIFYFETALRPGDRVDSGTTVRTLTADNLSKEVLADADVVVLANVVALPQAKAGLLAGFVREGGGLLISVGNQTEPAGYNQSMAALLPQPFAEVIDTGWGAGANEKSARSLRLEKLATDHPALNSFAPNAPELRDALFQKVMLLGPAVPNDDGTGPKVLARFSNGAAALVEFEKGAGRIAVFLSSIDRDWNDLAIHPGYLPLMQQMVRHLARRAAQVDESEYFVGSAVTLPTSSVSKMEIRGPAGISAVFDGDKMNGRTTVRFTKCDAPGLYQVRTFDRDRQAQNREDLAFTVNLHPDGSDLRPAPASLLPVSGTAGGDGKAPARQRIELWHGMAAAVLLLLLIEGLLLQRR
jgi:hypothetical protein